MSSPTIETEFQLDTRGPLDKLMTANKARLMADNQRVLDAVSRRSEAFAKWEAKQLGETMPESAEEMQISIDSPVVNHHHPPQQPQGSGIGKVLAGAALAAGLIGIPGAGVAGYFLSKLTDKPAATQPGTDDTVDIGLKRFSELVGGAK